MAWLTYAQVWQRAKILQVLEFNYRTYSIQLYSKWTYSIHIFGATLKLTFTCLVIQLQDNDSHTIIPNSTTRMKLHKCFFVKLRITFKRQLSISKHVFLIFS